MGKTILTGVDSSQTAISAAQKAAELAAGLGAELHVVTAYSTSTSDTLQSLSMRDSHTSTSQAYNNLTQSQAAAAAQIAEAVAEVLREEHPDLTVLATGAEGSPANALLNHAKSVKADTIVVGNKNVQGFSRVLGSVARKLVSEAQCDVYIVNTAHQ